MSSSSSTAKGEEEEKREEVETNLNPAVVVVLGLVATMMGYPALQEGVQK